MPREIEIPILIVLIIVTALFYFRGRKKLAEIEKNEENDEQ